MYYVYVLKNTKNKKLYFGYTTNLSKRVKSHNNGVTKSTNVGGKWELVYYEAYRSKADATKREWNLKHQGRQRDFLKKNITHSIQAAFV